jgi:hypothetical protein
MRQTGNRPCYRESFRGLRDAPGSCGPETIAHGGESLSAQGLLLRILPGQSTETVRIPSALVDATAFAATLVFASAFR